MALSRFIGPPPHSFDESVHNEAEGSESFEELKRREENLGAPVGGWLREAAQEP